MRNKSVVIEIKGWANIRKPILARDNYDCRICRKDGVEAKLNVHHIDYNRRNNDQSNLVTLCAQCHKAVHDERYMPCEYEDWPVPWGEHANDFMDEQE